MDSPTQEMWTNFKATLVFSLCISAVYLFYELAHGFPQHLYDCPGHTTQDLLTQVEGSEHLMMAAYRDHRMGGSTRVLAVINTEEPMRLDCVFCCPERELQICKGAVRKHSVDYGFKYIAGDVLCPTVPQCNATHVLLATHHHDGHVVGGPFLAIQHQETREKDFPVFFTVCMNSVYGDYNNAIQFIQTMEVYKLLGVQKVVLYLTTCGQDFYKVLQHYVDEGTLEIVPWWSQVLRGEINLNGELSVMNECIYRNRYTSQYVLLADVDQLLIPYNHTSLRTLMEELQGKHPEASVFQVETHVFLLFDDGPRNASQSNRPERSHMPGVDIFRQVYRVPLLEYDYRIHKLIINPRMVDQTASYEVIKSYGKTVDIPPNVCRIMQVEEPDHDTDKENLVLDNRLLDFAAHLAPQMNNTIKRHFKNKLDVL